MAAATTPAGILSPYLTQLQQMYGSFDPNQVQTRRRSYYSFVAYPQAGQSQFAFFGQTIGTSDRQLTNIQRSGHLDNPFIVKAMRCRYYITGQSNNSWAGTDASTLYSDIVNGLFTVGVLRVVITSKEWFQLPCPFQYAPAAYGIPEVWNNGTQGNNISYGPYAYPGMRGREAAYLVDPQFLIGSDQNFLFTIEYPGGIVPVISQTAPVTGNTTLYIGLELDGIEIRPLQ